MSTRTWARSGLSCGGLLLLAACGGDSTGPSAGHGPLTFVYEGATMTVRGTFAQNVDWFGEPAMQVYFTVESGKSCADLSPFLQGAYIVYLETGTNAYSSPSSYGFYMGTSSTGGSSTPSYPGAITSVTAVSVQGWVEAKELGSAANSSVTGDFAATFCP